MICVIIPAYNAEKTVAECIKAVLGQECSEEFEVVVVDDGSKDKTKEIAESFKGVNVIGQEHKGPAAGRNLGAKNLKGQIIVFLDADCIATGNWLKEMIAPFKNPQIAGVQGIYRSNQKELAARITQLEIEQRHEKMQKQEFIDFMGSYSAAYRKQAFADSGGFREDFPIASGEDTELAFRMSKQGCKFVLNPKAIVFHSHPNTLGQYLKVKFFRAFWRPLIYRHHAGKMLKDSYTSQTVKVQIGLFYLIVASLAAGIFMKEFFASAAALFVLLLLSTIPFTAWAARKDMQAAIAAPAFIVLRTAWFCAGWAAGTLNEIARR